MVNITRDEARAAWAASGLTYANLTLGNIQKLRDMIGAEMKSSGLIAPAGGAVGTYRIQPKIKAWLQSKGFGVELFCRSHYFKDREAITFNDGGFIGFAGWADETNVQPVLSAFVAWVGEVSA